MPRPTKRPADLIEPVLTCLRQAPGSHSPAVAEKLKTDVEAVRAALLRLEREGRVRREGATRATRWFAQVAEAELHPEKESASVDSTISSGPKPRRSALDPFAELVGKLPDAEVAQRAGVTREAVRIYRVRRDIPSATERASTNRHPRGRARPVETPAPAKESVGGSPRPANVAGLACWRVTIEGGAEPRFVLGATIAAAAARAEAALGQRVVGIEHVGEMLA